MRKPIRPLALFFALVFSALSAGAQTGKGKILDYERVELKNGMVVLLKEYHKLPLVYFELTLRGGASLDPAGKEGLANLTARLLRQGTKNRNAGQLAEELDFVGASLSANAGADSTTVRAEFLRKDVPLGLDLLAEVTTQPVFAEEEIERQKNSVLGQILRARENPSSIASRQFFAALYKTHPYGHAVQGTEESVNRISREDLLQFHADSYRPDQTILAVVGDFDIEELSAKIREAFGQWTGGEAGRPQRQPLPSPPGKWRVLLVDKPDVTQTQIRIGNFGIARKDPDYLPAMVANTILGGGFTSRLVEEIRVNRGLTYGAGSAFVDRVETGPFLVSTFSKNATALETIQVALEELRKFKEKGATAEEVEKAKSYMNGGFWLGLQTPESLAGQMTEIEFYGLPGDYVDSFQEKLRAVTPEEVKGAIDRHFPYRNLLLVVVSDAKSMKEQLESLGPVTVKNYLEE